MTAKLSRTTKRTILALGAIPLASVVVDYFGDLNWFGKYDTLVVAHVVVLFSLMILLLGPRSDEFNLRDGKERAPKIDSDGCYRYSLRSWPTQTGHGLLPAF